ncbi:MAG: hypothetical protein HYZ57_00260 [Acidobacteria bacterium]|nr:hypothetical protein [Acidobacteriota bacterium]MBI3278254.1 hypothetical protein [Acidobacteriota bacterium]
MSRAVLVCLLAASLAGAAETREQKGRKLLNEIIAALGADNFTRMEDRVETGRAYSFYREELTGLAVANIYTRYLKGIGKDTRKDLLVRERQAFGKDEDVIVLFGEDKGYTLTYRGAKPMKADRFKRYRDSTLNNVFYILRVRLHEPGMIFEHRGAEIVDLKPVEVLDITDAENRVVSVYVDRTTRLPTQQVFHYRDEEKYKVEEVTRFSKYRDVGGVQWPFNIVRERNGEKIFELFAESVKINQNLTDNLFTVPAGIKILPEK